MLPDITRLKIMNESVKYIIQDVALEIPGAPIAFSLDSSLVY